MHAVDYKSQKNIVSWITNISFTTIPGLVSLPTAVSHSTEKDHYMPKNEGNKFC
jgi:hypothetical protein